MPERLEQPLEEGLDYRQMWGTLRDELAWCTRNNVHAIDPFVVMGYMHFIQDMAEFDKKDST